MSDTREPMGPPSDVAPSELWAALTALPIAHEVVDFPMSLPRANASDPPIPVGKVAIVPLSPEELMMCQKVAGEWATKTTKETPKAGEESPAYRNIFGDEATIQILWRALRDPNDKTLAKKAFPAPAMLRRAPFTPDILSVLIKMYLRTCVVHGPIIATMTKEEMDAWLTVLEEGGAAFPLDTLSSGMLSDLLMHSVSRSKALRMANTSSGSQQDAPLPSSDPPPTMPDSDTPPEVHADDLPTT